MSPDLLWLIILLTGFIFALASLALASAALSHQEDRMTTTTISHWRTGYGCALRPDTPLYPADATVQQVIRTGAVREQALEARQYMTAPDSQDQILGLVLIGDQKILVIERMGIN